MSDFTAGVVTGVIIAAVTTLALSPVTAHIHASVAEGRAEERMQDVLQELPLQDIPDWPPQ